MAWPQGQDLRAAVTLSLPWPLSGPQLSHLLKGKMKTEVLLTGPLASLYLVFPMDSILPMSQDRELISPNLQMRELRLKLVSCFPSSQRSLPTLLPPCLSLVISPAWFRSSPCSRWSIFQTHTHPPSPWSRGQGLLIRNPRLWPMPAPRPPAPSHTISPLPGGSRQVPHPQRLTFLTLKMCLR